MTTMTDSRALDIARREMQSSEAFAHIAARLREPAGVGVDKPVAWWNGIGESVFNERDGFGPSIRWGEDAENSGHDIPLYSGYNPVRARQVALLEATAAAPQPHAEARECKCNMRTKLVGDGCDVCNPEYAAQFADDPAEAQANKWEALIGKWQARAEAAGYEGVEGALEAAEAQARPEKPAECANGCPERQVCDHCQYPPGPDAEAQAQGGGEVCIRLPGVGEGGPYPVVDGVCVLPPSVTRRLVASAVGREMKREAMAQWAATAPPSAPVGVEEWECRCGLRGPHSAFSSHADCPLCPAQTALAQQPAAEPTNEAVATFRRFLNGKQPVDGKITMKQARHILREWPGQQPAAVDGAMVDAARYRALVASGKFAPSVNSGWALAAGTYRATKDELDAAADALAAQPGGSDNDR